MKEPSRVITTSYVMKDGMDYTEAKVRVEGKDIRIRVGGRKTEEEHFPFLISEAESQVSALKGLNGQAVAGA